MGQGMHALAKVLPLLELYLPASQSVHAKEESEKSLYVPAGQAVQDTPFGIHWLLSLPQKQAGQDWVLLQVAVLSLAL